MHFQNQYRSPKTTYGIEFREVLEISVKSIILYWNPTPVQNDVFRQDFQNFKKLHETRSRVYVSRFRWPIQILRMHNVNFTKLCNFADLNRFYPLLGAFKGPYLFAEAIFWFFVSRALKMPNKSFQKSIRLRGLLCKPSPWKPNSVTDSLEKWDPKKFPFFRENSDLRFRPDMFLCRVSLCRLLGSELYILRCPKCTSAKNNDA